MFSEFRKEIIHKFNNYSVKFKLFKMSDLKEANLSLWSRAFRGGRPARCLSMAYLLFSNEILQLNLAHFWSQIFWKY